VSAESGRRRDEPAPERVRLDVWLDVACLFKTRSEAQKACRGGKVEVNGQRAKPHREVRVGDQIAITRLTGGRQRVAVEGLTEKHVAKAAARTLYDDVTPAPTVEELERRRMAALARPVRTGAGAPDKRQRRELRRLKGFEG
jgi:ribosome-associated heat shock protein Hsp15